MRTATNTLKRAEAFRVYGWAISRTAELETMTASEAAEAASQALGLKITEVNIRSMARDAGIKLKKIRPFRRTDPPANISKQIGFLACQIVQLARIVEELHATLGAKYPQDRLNLDVLRLMRIGVNSAVNENGRDETNS